MGDVLGRRRDDGTLLARVDGDGRLEMATEHDKRTATSASDVAGRGRGSFRTGGTVSTELGMDGRSLGPGPLDHGRGSAPALLRRPLRAFLGDPIPEPAVFSPMDRVFIPL